MKKATANVCELDPVRDPRWARFVDRHPQASVFHSPKWLGALQNAYGYQPVAVSTDDSESELTNGLVYCAVSSWLTGGRLVSLPFSDHCEPLVENPSDMENILLSLERQVDEGKWKHIELRPISLVPCGGTTRLEKSSTYSFHRIDLTPSLAELLRNCHKDSIQRKLRRAEREKLKYEEGASENLLEKFYRLLLITRRRHGLPPQPREWFRALIASFGGDLKIRVVSKGDVAVASILTLCHQKSIVYKYGCSDPAFNNMGGTVLLLWKTIEEGKAAGMQVFDLGRSDIDNAGLITFKHHWGAVASTLSYWSYPHRNAESSTGVAGRLFSMMPDAALQAAGKLLYKHFG